MSDMMHECEDELLRMEKEHEEVGAIIADARALKTLHDILDQTDERISMHMNDYMGVSEDVKGLRHAVYMKLYRTRCEVREAFMKKMNEGKEVTE